MNAYRYSKHDCEMKLLDLLISHPRNKMIDEWEDHAVYAKD